VLKQFFACVLLSFITFFGGWSKSENRQGQISMHIFLVSDSFYITEVFKVIMKGKKTNDSMKEFFGKLQIQRCYGIHYTNSKEVQI
jgi:hypothetical protein